MNAFLRRSSEKCQSGRMDLIRNQAHERLCRGFESLFLLNNCLKSLFGVIQMGFFSKILRGLLFYLKVKLNLLTEFF